jgi:hypothetical protein
MVSRDNQNGVVLGLVWPAADSVRRIADAMADVAAMRVPDLRQQVLTWVKQRNRAFDPPRSNRDLEEITNFILACRDDDESFDLLLEAIELYTASDDPKLLELQELVDTLLPRAALNKGELHELLALEPGQVAKPKQLAAGIRRVRPEPASRESRDIQPRDVREAALFLLDAPSAEKGLVRLLRFVDWLAQLASLMGDSPDSSLPGELQDWAERVGGAHCLPRTAWQTAARPVPSGEPALLIELEPAVSDLFTVYLWLWVPGAGACKLDWDEDPISLEELRDRIDELLELAHSRLAGTTGALRVEFLLDLETFHRDMDLWVFGTDEGLPRPLGAEHLVIVRRQRSTAKEQRCWQARWQALQQTALPVADLAVWLKDATTLTLQDLWAQLDNDPTKIVVAPLGTCEKLDTEMKTFIYLTLKQGMPVALWLRHVPADAAQYLDSIRTQLAGTRLAELPERVRGWRKQAFLEGGTHFGQYLVLLWDDYDRRLPDADSKLALPAVKGARP